jgi:hypothetical protein
MPLILFMASSRSRTLRFWTTLTNPRRKTMNVYSQQHAYYCGIDLHARTMYICILDQSGAKVLHKNYPCSPEAFLEAVAPYRSDLVVTTECVFCWYWLADLCEQENIPFVLGHALYVIVRTSFL